MINAEQKAVLLRDIAEIKTGPFGSALHESDYKRSGTPIVTVEHLGERGLTRQNLPLVGDSDAQRLRAYRCRPGDILFSRVGSIDRNSLVKDAEDGWLFSGRLLRVRVDEAIADPRFLGYQLGTQWFKESVRAVAVGQTMPSLNTQILGSLTVYLPDLATQARVVERLRSVDDLVATLERLFAKKQAIKLGMMQELLTGRTRLLGYIDEWSNTRLGDVLKFHPGFPFPSQQFSDDPSGVRLVRNRDLRSNDSMIYISGNVPATCELATGDVLIGMDGDFEPIIWSGGRAALNQRVGRLRFTSRVHSEFMAYALIAPLKELEHGTGATTVKHLSHSDVENLVVALPSYAEQVDIAQVLVDADRQLGALDARLRKARAIKKGMIQQLLTGKIRLSVGGVS